jgi:hypothetical protein
MFHRYVPAPFDSGHRERFQRVEGSNGFRVVPKTKL